jgi:hypothetical protein
LDIPSYIVVVIFNYFPTVQTRLCPEVVQVTKFLPVDRFIRPHTLQVKWRSVTFLFCEYSREISESSQASLLIEVFRVFRSTSAIYRNSTLKEATTFHINFFPVHLFVCRHITSFTARRNNLRIIIIIIIIIIICYGARSAS